MNKSMLLMILALSGPALSASLPIHLENKKTKVWSEKNSPITINGEYHCKKNGHDALLIQGQVDLAHPADKGLHSYIEKIIIVCPYLHFEQGALRSDSHQQYKITEILSGDVDIRNTRGKKGEAGSSQSQEVWGRTKAADGKPGRRGNTSVDFGAPAQKGHLGQSGQNVF